MRKDFEHSAEQSDNTASPPPAPAKPPIISLDVSLYEAYLAQSGLNDEQKREFLQALWSIIVGFVDLGFGIHPVEQALESGSCEPALELGERDAANEPTFQEEEKDREHLQSLRGEIARSFARKEEQ